PGAIYTVSAQDKANGGVNLTITTTGSAPCTEIQDFVTLAIPPAPTSTVNAGFDQILCQDVDSVSLLGLFTIAGGAQWSIITPGATGTFTPSDSTLEAIYLPSAADKALGTVTLRLTTSQNGICVPAFDDMTVTFTAPPTVSTSAVSPVCADVASIALTDNIT